jgi:hypothetical protein
MLDIAAPGALPLASSSAQWCDLWCCHADPTRSTGSVERSLNRYRSAGDFKLPTD